MSKIVTDPLGQQVIISQAFLEATDKMVQAGEVMDDVQKMIERPAMLFRMTGDCNRLFYLRAIGWNTTILAEVQKTERGYQLVNYQLNPDMEYMRRLHAGCERLM